MTLNRSARGSGSAVGIFCLLAIACGSCNSPSGGIEYDWDETPVVTLSAIREVPWSPGGFYSVDGFAADSTGTVFVGDALYKQVVAIDQAGTIIWRWAAPGTATLNAMGVGFGLVAVADRGSGSRVFVIDSATGELVRTHDYDAVNTSVFANGKPLRVLNSEGAVSLGIEDPTFERHLKYPELDRWRRYLITLDEAESRIELPNLPGILIVLPKEDGSVAGATPPLVPRFVWSPNPWGSWTGAAGYDYQITVNGPNGEHLITRPVGPREPSAVARRREGEFLRDFSASNPEVQGREKELAADTIGHFFAMSYSRDGSTLWVARTFLEPDPVYDVWASEGTFLCSVQLDMGGDNSVLRSAPPFLVNDRLYHLAENTSSQRPRILVFDVSDACEDGHQ